MTGLPTYDNAVIRWTDRTGHMYTAVLNGGGWDTDAPCRSGLTASKLLDFIGSAVIHQGTFTPLGDLSALVGTPRFKSAVDAMAQTEKMHPRAPLDSLLFSALPSLFDPELAPVDPARCDGTPECETSPHNTRCWKFRSDHSAPTPTRSPE